MRVFLHQPALVRAESDVLVVRYCWRAHVPRRPRVRLLEPLEAAIVELLRKRLVKYAVQKFALADGGLEAFPEQLVLAEMENPMGEQAFLKHPPAL